MKTKMGRLRQKRVNVRGETKGGKKGLRSLSRFGVKFGWYESFPELRLPSPWSLCRLRYNKLASNQIFPTIFKSHLSPNHICLVHSTTLMLDILNGILLLFSLNSDGCDCRFTRVRDPITYRSLDRVVLLHGCGFSPVLVLQVHLQRVRLLHALNSFFLSILFTKSN